MTKRVFTLCAVAAMMAACGADGEVGPAGQTGAAALVDTAAEPAGANCETGGIVIRTGLDADADGELGDAEIIDTSYICNGPTGEAGEPGEGGEPGAPALVETDEATTCGSSGGIVIRTGVDADGDGALSDDEVSDEETVCNAPDTANGAILIQEVEIEPGDQCGGGGVAVQVGRDVNENGTLEAEEVESQLLECGPCPTGYGPDPADPNGCVIVHTITFEGVIDTVNDDDGIASGITVGDTFTGTIVLLNYTLATDSNPDIQIGAYSFQGVPSSFTVEIDGKTYTSTLASEMSVELADDFGILHADEYRIHSLANEKIGGVTVDTMSLNLIDQDGTTFGADVMRLPIPMAQVEQSYLMIELSQGQDSGGGTGGPVEGGSYANAFGDITSMNIQ